MDIKEMQELAKSAANSALIAHSVKSFSMSTTEAVDEYLKAYEYAFKKIAEKQRQSQSEVNMEFGSNAAMFR